MMLSFQLVTIAAPAAIFVESWRELLGQIWYYLDHKHQILNHNVSVTTVVGGALIFAVALFLSRTLSTLLERRISKRPDFDRRSLYRTFGRHWLWTAIHSRRHRLRFYSSLRAAGASRRSHHYRRR